MESNSDTDSDVYLESTYMNDYNLSLSAVQLEAIKKLFKDNNWDFTISESNTDNTINSSENNSDVSSTKDKDRLCEIFKPDQKSNAKKCAFCYLSPCITDECNRQSWWSNDSTEPSSQNSRSRKNCYQRFWGMLANYGVWESDEYQRKKRNSLRIETENIILKREIMPDCVLHMVRTWYPNPKGQPYMGHKWR